MKQKNWIIFILLLIIPGVAGRIYLVYRDYQQKKLIVEYKDTYHQQSQQYLELYKKWSQLTPEEKSEQPWGQGAYGGTEIRQKLQENQYERLVADMPELLSNSGCPPELAEILYGSNWQKTVNAYRKKIELQEILALITLVLMLSGGFLGGIYSVYWIGILAYRLFQKYRKSQSQIKAIPDTELQESGNSASESVSQIEKDVEVPPSQNRFASGIEEESSPSLGYFESFRRQTQKSTPCVLSSAPTSSKSPAVSTAELCLKDAEEAIEELSEDMVSSLMTPEPASKELTELTEQMSAIREYAAEQQSHMRKLQDGYDWLIIKRFCLRIIRCVDNIEDRMRMLAEQEQDISVLEDIRDELVFALESSGVEPFEPELEREYRGLEKYAEAVKERFENNDPEQTGKIAKIVRPGYQYLINDEEVKIVRCAQVKLYA